jgi:hypothetical protein
MTEHYRARLVGISTRFARFRRHLTKGDGERVAFVSLPLGKPLVDDLEKVVGFAGLFVEFTVDKNKVVAIKPLEQ